MPIRLSIIVPTLNEAELIGPTLGRLQSLRSQGHELIVVDGGSTDATVESARAQADRVIQAPRGRALQMNAGAAIATGEVLWFLHADTLVPEAAAQALQAALANGQRCWGRFDVRLSGRHPLLRVIERLMNLRSCASGIATGDQGMFVHRELFNSAGGYPEIPLMEDVALSRVLRAIARPVCVKPALITSSRRWESRGVWRTVLLMWRLRLAYALGADPQELAKRYQ